MPLARRVQHLARRARQGDLSMIAADIGRSLHSDTSIVGFRWRADDPVAVRPEPVMDLVVEPLSKVHAAAAFDLTGLKGKDRLYLERRRAMWERGFEGGYVALDDRGRVAYLQFHIPAFQNDLVRAHWGAMFPRLEPGTVLTEGAWTPPPFRKRGLMAQAIELTLQAALADSDDLHASITYVYPDNSGALIGCCTAGYRVWQKRTETWRLGRQSFRFEPATEADFPGAKFAPGPARSEP